MSDLKYLVIHCSETPKGRSITAETVRNWHCKPKPIGRGWAAPGYSDLILLDGSRHRFTKHDNDCWVEITNGGERINGSCRHICYIGGLTADGKIPENTLDHAQNAALSAIIAEVLGFNPEILIAGHNQFVNKPCPSFFVPEYLRSQCLVKVPEKNIFTLDPFKYGTYLP